MLSTLKQGRVQHQKFMKQANTAGMIQAGKKKIPETFLKSR